MSSLSNNQLLVKEYVKEEYKENVTYNDIASFFEFFAASQVLKDFDLSDEEIEKGIMGAGNDGGCDGIFLFLNNLLLNEEIIESLGAPREAKLELIIIQAKNTTSFGEDAIMKWKTVSDNLLRFDNQNDYSSRYNSDILSAFQSFKDVRIKLIRSKIKLSIRYYYVTVASELHPNVLSQAEELKASVHSLFPNTNTDVVVNFIDADQLMSLINSDSEHVFNLPLVDSPIALGKKRDYVALANIGEYYKFITDETGEMRKYIFEANVRDYQGRNSVNNEIQETLANASIEDFWWLNNGVTILAKEASLATGKEIIITDPEIVNGLQTSTEIYNYFSTRPDQLSLDNRNVLLRILVPENETSRDKIILATNNQTTIPKASLRVTDSIHLQIEMYFKSRGLFYDRRKNYYKNQGRKPSEIISVSFLAQCLISLILQRPDSARARPSTLLSNEDIYRKLYVDNTDLEVFYKCAIIGKKVDKQIKSTSEYTNTEKNDIVFYTLYYLVASTIGNTTITATAIKDLDIAILDDSRIANAAASVYEEYFSLGATSIAAKGPTLITNIKKSLDHSLKMQSALGEITADESYEEIELV